MISAVEHYGHVTPAMKELLHSVRVWMDGLPAAPPSIREDGLWSCHGLCRAVHQRWQLHASGWSVRDGYFSGNYRHSWLLKRLNAREGLIMDVYPVASTGGPLLFEALSPASPWRTYYKEAPTVIRSSMHAVQREANALLAA